MKNNIKIAGIVLMVALLVGPKMYANHLVNKYAGVDNKTTEMNKYENGDELYKDKVRITNSLALEDAGEFELDMMSNLGGDYGEFVVTTALEGDALMPELKDAFASIFIDISVHVGNIERKLSEPGYHSRRGLQGMADALLTAYDTMCSIQEPLRRNTENLESYYNEAQECKSEAFAAYQELKKRVDQYI